MAPSDGVFVCTDGRTEPWRIRRSSKARHPSIRVSAKEGVVIVLPERFRGDPESILERNRSFVERTTKRIASERSEVLQEAARPLPTELVFNLTGERWKVVYDAARTEGIKVSAAGGDTGGTVHLVGPQDDRAFVEKALSHFVLMRAKVVLPRLLEACAQRLKISYRDCRVSGARTRWGSCTSDDRIMLSAQLMFLPPELVSHVMAHELSHTRHHDHSKSFHVELDRLDPESAQHERSLRTATTYVPYWMA